MRPKLNKVIITVKAIDLLMLNSQICLLPPAPSSVDWLTTVANEGDFDFLF
jgi:hypothetical protein